MNAKLSQAFLIFTIFVLIATVVWLVYPSQYRVCHFVVTGLGRAHLYPQTAKFKPYKGKTMGGAALMASVIKEEIASFTAKDEPYCFVSLGAELSGTAEAFLTKGEAVAKVFNAMKLDAMLVGNIDFSFGKERLAEIAKANSFKLLSSNVTNTADGKTPDYFSDEILLDAPNDLKIGLLGISPVNTPNLAAKENVEGLSFSEPDLILKKRVDSLRAKGADVVALLTQYNKEYITADEWKVIASASPDICFMLDTDMEAPSPFAKDGVIVYSVSAYNQTKEIDILNLEITKKRPVEIVGISSRRIGTNIAEYDEDPEMAKIVDDATVAIRAQRDTFIGNFASEYSRSYYGECPIGNLVTDAMLAATGADVALQNSGSIQNNISEGRFTLGDLYTVMPFANRIVTMNLKGSDIIEALTISASRQRGVLQVSGLAYAYEYKSRNDYKLTKATINGEGIVPDKVYKVVTNSFLTDGGDNYIPFTRGTDVAKLDSQREVIKNYIASASQEAPIALKTEGRIIVEE